MLSLLRLILFLIVRLIFLQTSFLVGLGSCMFQINSNHHNISYRKIVHKQSLYIHHLGQKKSAVIGTSINSSCEQALQTNVLRRFMLGNALAYSLRKYFVSSDGIAATA